MYHIDRIIRVTGEVVDNGTHEVYANRAEEHIIHAVIDEVYGFVK